VFAELRGGGIEAERKESPELPSYVDALTSANPARRLLLDRENISWKFRWLFICWSSSREIFRCCPRFIACNATFTKARFRRILPFATTINGNDEIVFLAWAVVESENEDSWSGFFEHLKQAPAELNDNGFKLFSDRDKGLVIAASAFPKAVRAYCCLDIAENV
jgi:hypothetical protein